MDDTVCTGPVLPSSVSAGRWVATRSAVVLERSPSRR